MIQGVNVAAVTPRRTNADGIDLAASLELIDFLCKSGVKGIALLGSTGEFTHFDIADRIRLTQLAVKRSRVPVIVNVSHSCADRALVLAREAASHGAAALLLMPPYFFRYSREDIDAFFRYFASEFEAPTPVFLYNIPVFTNGIAPETAVAILKSGLYAGIKDSSGVLTTIERMIEIKESRSLTVLVGNDSIYAEAIMAGADGVISGVGCALPELMLAIHRAITAADTKKVERLNRRLLEFIAWIDSFPTPIGVREAVAARGLKTGPHAIPLGAQAERKLAEFREWFQGWLPGLLKETSGA